LQIYLQVLTITFGLNTGLSSAYIDDTDRPIAKSARE